MESQDGIGVSSTENNATSDSDHVCSLKFKYDGEKLNDSLSLAESFG